jgi:hypothetical protein
MRSSGDITTPTCPDCNASMRLTRVLPCVLPKDQGTETSVFMCTSCGTTITRTVHACNGADNRTGALNVCTLLTPGREIMDG